MRKSYQFVGEDGERCTVVYGLSYTEDALRPYGIQGQVLEKDSKVIESARLSKGFLTKGEAEAWMVLLVREQVMPCTMNDVIG